MEPQDSAPGPQSSVLTVPIAIIVAGVLIAAAVLYTGFGGFEKRDASPTANLPAEPEKIVVRPVSADDHILGSPDAEVFLIEYSDLECPFCKRFHVTMHQLMDVYGKTGQLAWVYRQFPIVTLHSKAPDESHASECVAELAGNTAFWDYIDTIFEITPANNGLDLSLLSSVAESLGIDPAAFEECQQSGRHRNRIEADLADGVAAGLTGTPYSVFINQAGDIFPVNGAVSYASLEATLFSALDSDA